MKISQKGIGLIKRFEGCKLNAYICPAGIPTIGYGSTDGVTIGDSITQDEAEVLLREDLERFERGVEALAPDVNQNQFDALVSFAYNLGLAALSGSTLLKKVKAKEWVAAADEFPKWKHAGGKVLPGLVARRAAEALLFLET